MHFLMALFVTLSSHAEIIFPVADPFLDDKQKAMSEILTLMPEGGSVGRVLNSEKVFLWANSVPQELLGSTSQFTEKVDLPLFIPVTSETYLRIRNYIIQSCHCELLGKKVGGIIVAHPNVAAKMYYRPQWAPHLAGQIDGIAPPIVIIYHEFSHASDYLLNSEYFFDMAATFDQRWLNKAEESAVQQQNDLVHTIAFKKGIYYNIRRSYGPNIYLVVNDIYAID